MDMKERNKKAFVSKVNKIMGTEDGNENIIDFYDKLMGFAMGEEVVDAVLRLNTSFDCNGMLINKETTTYNRKEILVIDREVINYIKKDGFLECETKNSDYVKSYFGNMLTRLKLPPKIQEMFIYRGDDFGKVNFTRYKVYPLNNSEEDTINSLKKCISLVRGETKTDILDFLECCKLLIEMLPVCKLVFSGVNANDCRYEICNAFRNLYLDRIMKRKETYMLTYNKDTNKKLLLEYLVRTSDVEFWEFLMDLKIEYAEELEVDFWELLEEKLKVVLRDYCKDFFKDNFYEGEIAYDSKKSEKVNLKEILIQQKK